MGCRMKIIVTLFTAGCLAGIAHAEPSTTEPTAQVTHGIHMRLAPPKVPLLESEDPLDVITQQMTGVVDDIAALKTGQPVQHEQKEIVDSLDTINKGLEQQKSGNGGGGNPTRPMTDSRIARGPGGIGDLKNPSLESRNFATLPPKDRDAILQSKTEGFPPGYESLLQSYYSRLAEEKGSGHPASGDSAGPTGNSP